MPFPTSIRDMNTVAASNSPPGSEAVGTSLDEYLRAIQSSIRNFWAIGGDVTAAATIDCNAFDSEAVRVTGTATVTSLGTCPAGFTRELRFAAVCTLTHSASLLLPGAVNLVTAANDICTFRSLGSGNWILVGRTSGNAAPIAIGTTANRIAVWSAANARWEQAGDADDLRGNVRDIPLNVQNAAYTLVLDDRGRTIIKTNTTVYTWTIPLESTTNFPNGSAISILNDGTTANVTITPVAGVTLLEGSVIGGYNLLPNNARTLLKVGTNRWRVI